MVAGRLSERPGCRVLLLEAGGRDWSPYLRVPVGRMRLNNRFDWNYPGEPDPSLLDKREFWDAGKILGGTSSINGMLWTRGDRTDYDSWSARGCKGWDFESVLPYFKKAETFECGGDAFRGGDGPVRVSYLRSRPPLIDTFIESAELAGYPHDADYNSCDRVRSDGVAFGQVSQKRGLRHSSARAYLQAGARRGQLQIRTHAFARRIVVHNGRAVGVEYLRYGKLCREYASREIVVSAGTVGSPKLLMLSGFGHAEELSAFGIPVLAHIPGVGKNLQNHIGLKMLYQVDTRTLNRELSPWRVLKHSMDFVFRGQGAATTATGHAVLYGSLGDVGLDYGGTVNPFGIVNKHASGPNRHKASPAPLNVVTTLVALLHPRAVGSVELRSADPGDQPRIRYQGFGDPADVAALRAACRRVRCIFATPPFSDHVVRELVPGAEMDSDDSWTEVFRSRGHVSKHHCGTCKMGDDERSVVDPSLRVRGVKGLRVVDASIMPTVTSGGTNAPTIMIGERAADFLLRSGLED